MFYLNSEACVKLRIDIRKKCNGKLYLCKYFFTLKNRFDGFSSYILIWIFVNIAKYKLNKESSEM